MSEGGLAERLFLQHKEDGVDELDVLDVVVEHVVGHQALNEQNDVSTSSDISSQLREPSMTGDPRRTGFAWGMQE